MSSRLITLLILLKSVKLHTPPVVISSDDAITLSDDDLPIPTRKSLKTVWDNHSKCVPEEKWRFRTGGIVPQQILHRYHETSGTELE